MKRVAFLLALLLPAALAGCDELLFNGADDVQLRTDASQYAPGDTATLRLVNESHETIGYNLCAHLVQRRDGDRWVDTLYGHDAPCLAIWYRLRHDDFDTHPAPLDADIPPGSYRFRTRVEMADGEHRIYTRAFTVAE